MMDAIIYALGWTLIHFIWQAAIAACLMALMLACTGRTQPSLRSSLAVSALTALFALPLATFAILLAGGGSSTERILTPSRVVLQVPLIGPSPDWLNEIANLFDASRPWLMLAWAVWVAAQAIRLAGGWMLGRRTVRRGAEPASVEFRLMVERVAAAIGLSRGIECMVSARITVPQIVGVLRPLLVVPAAMGALDAAALEAIIAHELAHIARRDHWVNAMLAVAELLFGFHPAVRYIAGVVRNEREFCCDEIAARHMHDRATYARALLSLEESAAALTLAANGGSLRERVARLLDSRCPRYVPIAASLAALCLAGGLMAFTPLQAPPPKQAPTSQPEKKSAPAAPARKGASKRIATEGGPSAEQMVRIEAELERVQAEMQAKQAELQTIQERLHERAASELREREAELLATQAQMRAIQEELHRSVNQREQHSAEHRRRIEYSRKLFGGADTPRGRTYVKFGPPDQIESHPGDHEIWRYKSLPEVGNDVSIRFSLK